MVDRVNPRPLWRLPFDILKTGSSMVERLALNQKVEGSKPSRSSTHGPVAQSAERTAVNRQVAGSMPARSAPPQKPPSKAQRVEHADDTVSSNGPDIRTLEDLLKAARVDLTKWRVSTWRSNTWAGNWQVRANLERIPEFLTCIKEVTIRREPTKPRKPGQKNRTATVADMHGGYDWDFRTRELTPWHDEVAAELELQWLIREQPDDIVLNGDLIDFAPLSTKFKRSPEQRYTVQPALEWLHGWLVRLRRGCPRARIWYTGGNHEERLLNYLIEKADEATCFRDVETGDLVNSIQSLLKLDALDIKYVDEVNIDGVWYRHAGAVKQGGGATAAANVSKAQAHTVTGHIHREETAWKNVTRPDGSRGRVLALSVGCSCHTDGRVPQGGKQAPDWQQGVAMITTYGDGSDVCAETGSIQDGALFWRGERYELAPETE